MLVLVNISHTFVHILRHRATNLLRSEEKRERQRVKNVGRSEFILTGAGCLAGAGYIFNLGNRFSVIVATSTMHFAQVHFTMRSRAGRSRLHPRRPGKAPSGTGTVLDRSRHYLHNTIHRGYSIANRDTLFSPCVGRNARENGLASFAQVRHLTYVGTSLYLRTSLHEASCVAKRLPLLRPLFLWGKKKFIFITTRALSSEFTRVIAEKSRK